MDKNDWSSFCWEVCQKNNKMIIGPDETVEIDHSKFITPPPTPFY